MRLRLLEGGEAAAGARLVPRAVFSSPRSVSAAGCCCSAAVVTQGAPGAGHGCSGRVQSTHARQQSRPLTGAGASGTDFLSVPERGEAARCRRGCRDAHATSVQSAHDSRLAVAGSDGIMLVSGVAAVALRIRRRLAVRWCCRHEVTFPQNPAVRSPSRPPVGLAAATCLCRRLRRAQLPLFTPVNRALTACEIINLA